jgi:hypothetical protein
VAARLSGSKIGRFACGDAAFVRVTQLSEIDSDVESGSPLDLPLSKAYPTGQGGAFVQRLQNSQLTDSAHSHQLLVQ